MKTRSLRVIVPAIAALALVTAFVVHFLTRSGGVPALRVTGIIDGTEANLSSKVSGRISEIRCREGDRILAGQRVISLESGDVRASVDQAIAGVERARADLKAAEAAVGGSVVNIRSAEADRKSAAADAEKARAQMAESKREAERRRELYGKNLISRESFDQMAAASDADAASYDSAKEKVSAAESREEYAVSQRTAAESRRNSARAALGEASANLAFYRSRLNDTIIATPVTGTVIFKAHEKGETVSPGTAILTVVDLSSLYARIDVDETKIGRVILDGAAFVTVDGVPGKVFKGKVSEIGRYAEFATQRDVIRGREDIKTFRVKVAVEDPSGILKPGMTVEVAIPGKR